MSRLVHIPVEAPAPVRPLLVALLGVGLGSYLLLAALAIAEIGTWSLALVPAALACFGAAGRELYALLRRR
ncbi:MAG: hypothetical protein IRZ20_00480 [Thermoleophilia bacterium]|nr:hypothetical protein [Thermoleophilia bacterium]